MDEMILKTGKQLPASAGLYHPVFISLPFVLACLLAGVGSNFGVSKKGLPHPPLTPAPETIEAAVAVPTAASISAPGPLSPKGRELADGLGDPFLVR